MARLIDADKLKNDFDNTNITEYGFFPNNVVDAQPTAYSVEKVVEELEENKRKLLSYVKDYEEVGNFAMAEIYSDRANEYTNAIEIVKQGGVADDVCEWERTIDGNVAVWKIECSDYLPHQCSDIDKSKYCPYCGKKIKVVE